MPGVICKYHSILAHAKKELADTYQLLVTGKMTVEAFFQNVPSETLKHYLGRVEPNYFDISEMKNAVNQITDPPDYELEQFIFQLDGYGPSVEYMARFYRIYRDFLVRRRLAGIEERENMDR